jgi:8-oxo-dGTP pyrophosphatase MutT (NUDIX family)
MKSASKLLPAALHRLAYRSAYRLLQVWWWVRRPSVSGAAVACWWAGRLLVVRPSYRARLHLPCGGIRRGEDARAAALRELHEEAAIDAPPEALSGPHRLEFVDEGRSIVDWVFEWHPTRRPEPRVDQREIVWAGWLTPGELDPLLLTPTLRLYLTRHG